MDFELQLRSETVGRMVQNVPLCVEPRVSIRDVFGQMKEQNAGAVLICRDGVLAGIFTERDALRLMASGAGLDQPVERVMVAGPVTLSTSDTVGCAIEKMSSGGYRHLPIVDDEGHPVGLLKVSGILHYLVEHFPELIYTLPPQPHHSTQQREGA